MFDIVPSAAEDIGPGTLATTLELPWPGAALLVVAGEVDTLTADRLQAVTDDLLATGCARLVIDLSGVTFLASSGLAVLIRAAHLATASSRRLRLVAEGRPVLRPLQITGTDELFDRYTSRGPALQPDRD